MSRLPPALSDREVLGYLNSGLTTTLLVGLSAKGTLGERTEAAARIEVRFEPWEEVYHVTLTPAQGPPQRLRLTAAEGIEPWWRSLSLSFPVRGRLRGSARIELSVIPFSEEEEADARRWYAEALRNGEGAHFAEVLDVLTLTSIKRRGVLRFSWSAPAQTP